MVGSIGSKALWLVLFFAFSVYGAEKISALYLSWYEDPTTTMTVQWHTPPEGEREEFHLEKPDGTWQVFKATSHPFPGEYLLIHTVGLKELASDTSYRFRFGTGGEVYSFRTAPKTLDHPVRFVIGGDLYISPKLFQKMSQTVVDLDPLFAVLGGDLAYALSPGILRIGSSAAKKWCAFLADWKELLITKEKRVIPFVIAAGNHDIAPDDYELFFRLFAFPQRQLYRTLDFGSYLSLVLLDTGHFQPIEGRQTVWLKKALKEREKVPFILAAYHVGAYPSFYPYQEATSKKVRTHWCPLFDLYGIKAAFEHHSHAFKRTYPLKDHKVDPQGTVYFGDGCWGAPPRKTHDLWYLEKKARKNNVYLAEIKDLKSLSIKAIGLNGELLDEAAVPSRNSH